jgi:hypothetical protein
MSKQHHEKDRAITGLLFLAAYFIVIGAASSQAQTTRAPAASTAQTKANQAALVIDAVKANFGPVVEVETVFAPFYVTGDFNGDAAMDVAVVVRISGQRVNLPKDVRVLNPFEDRTAAKFPDNPATANKLALVIIHSWKATQPVGKFLLIGEAPVLILEHSRATSTQPDDRKDLIELMSRNGKRPKGEKLPRGSKGDVIILGSEVGESTLYWNGRTYVWEDSADD